VGVGPPQSPAAFSCNLDEQSSNVRFQTAEMPYSSPILPFIFILPQNFPYGLASACILLRKGMINHWAKYTEQRLASFLIGF
jgi:hypothetical protein